MRQIIPSRRLARRLVAGASALLLARPAAFAGTPPMGEPTLGRVPLNVIFDTDMWGDIDDALALAMLHSLHDRREVNLVAVTISTDDAWSAQYVDLINTFYGHPEIPIGMVLNGVNAEQFLKRWGRPATRYTRTISERKNGDGSPLYPRRALGGDRPPEAVAVLRETLAAQPDGSVVIVQVGYSTNLARLLESAPDVVSPLKGHDLVKQKVWLLSIMAGNFDFENYARARGVESSPAEGFPEFNLVLDVPAAQKLMSEWPTPAVISGNEVGGALPYPRASIQDDYAYVAHHPIADTYRLFCEEIKNPSCPHEHATFDLTSVLYAARRDRSYFSLSKPGKMTVLDDGGTRFEESVDGLHRFMWVTAQQKARAVEAMALLASQPPVRSDTRVGRD